MPLDLARQQPLAARRLEASLGPGWYAWETARTQRHRVASMLMPWNSRRLLTQLQATVKRLGVDIGEVYMHRLRRSGAPHDYDRQVRSIEDIRKAFNSVRRYEKGARVQQLLVALPEAVRAHALACEESLGDLFHGACRPLNAPWLPTFSSSCSPRAKASQKI